MTVTANTIIEKPTDYKVCTNCRAVNWYENTECHSCDETKFTKNKKVIIEETNSYIEIEYDYRDEYYDTNPAIDVGDHTFIEV